MQITVDKLSQIAGAAANANMKSIVVALDTYGASAGLDKPHRLAQFLAQVAHESGSFRYDREVWGPTPAQTRYDTRADLGNTPAVDGDGKKNAGRGPMQLTGAHNIAAFYRWCVARGPNPPDFTANPDLINTDPWEGLSAIWYWTAGNPTGKSLNAFADANDIEMITRRINGGLNGFADRINFYVRAALVLAGYGPEGVKSFQIDAQRAGLLPADEPGKPTQVDGDAGPKTRAALHLTLAAMSAPSAAVQPAPVVTETEVEKPVPVAPKGADKTLMSRVISGVGIGAPVASFVAPFDQTGKFILLAVGVGAVILLLWKAELIAARVRKVVALFDGETVQ